MDGYIELDLELQSGGSTGFFLVPPESARLRCPKSEKVASQLMESIRGFNLSQVNTNIYINVTTSDFARNEIPETWRDERSHQVRLDRNHMVTSSTTLALWNWILEHCHTSTYDVLSGVSKLEG